MIKETKIAQNKFDTFDTVELRYGYEFFSFKGFILDYVIDKNTEKGFYDSVFLGYYKNSEYNFMGHFIKIQTTRMVLVEKYDYRLIESIKYVSSIRNFIIKE